MSAIKKLLAISTAIALCSSLVLSVYAENDANTVLESGWTRYEAENQNIVNYGEGGNNDGTESQSFFSNGLAAANMNKDTMFDDIADDWSNLAYVDFTVNVDVAGVYAVKIAYNGDDDKHIVMRTNNGTNTLIHIPAMREDHQWDILHAVVQEVNLNAGANSIQISGTVNAAGWANIDFIDVVLVSADEPAAEAASVEETDEEVATADDEDDDTYEEEDVEATAAVETASAPDATVEDIAPVAETEVATPATGNTAAVSVSTKGSADTGIADVASISAIAVIAAGAVVVIRKKK